MTAPGSAEAFDRSVGIFLAFVLLGLGIAVISDAPLAFDGVLFSFGE